MPQPPVLSTEQRATAYQRSLKLRQERVELKRGLASGEIDMKLAWSFLPQAQGMEVIDLLKALPGIGQARAEKLLQEAGIPAKNTVRACGPKQAERLFVALESSTSRTP